MRDTQPKSKQIAYLRRWILRVVMIDLALVILIVGAMELGHRVSTSGLLDTYGYSVCDGQPCFLGIIPGITKWDDAKDIVSMHRSRVDYDLENISIRSDQNEVIVVLQRGDANFPNVTEIHSDPDNYLMPSVYEIINRYGPPCGTRIVELNKQWELVYPNLLVSFISPQSQLTLNTDIVSLTIADTLESYYGGLSVSKSCQIQQISGNGFLLIPWRGFISEAKALELIRKEKAGQHS